MIKSMNRHLCPGTRVDNMDPVKMLAGFYNEMV